MCGPYPDLPGSKGLSETSSEAAEAIAPAASYWRTKAIVAICSRRSGFTAEELAAHLGCERVTIQPRTSELRALGSIKDSGERRYNRSGKRAIVWVAIEVAA